MKNIMRDHDKGQFELLLSVPKDIHKDLEKIATFKETSLEDLAFSYLIDGIAGDARLVKREEFREHVSEAFDKDESHSKSSRSIINDFNLVY